MAVVISDRLLEGSDRLLDAERDEQLVTLVQAGHEAAFAAIVRRYERELQAQARRLTSDGRGEDAVQQAFLNAFTALQRGGRCAICAAGCIRSFATRSHGRASPSTCRSRRRWPTASRWRTRCSGAPPPTRRWPSSARCPTASAMPS